MDRRRHDGFRVITQLALELSPHVFVRPGELRRREWDEINWEQAC